MAKKRPLPSKKKARSAKSPPRPRGRRRFAEASPAFAKPSRALAAAAATPQLSKDREFLNAFVRTHAVGLTLGGVAAAALSRHPSFLPLDNIQAVFFGQRKRGGVTDTHERVIKVLVKEKSDTLPPEGRIPRQFSHGERVMPTDVEPMTVRLQIVNPQAGEHPLHQVWNPSEFPVPCGFAVRNTQGPPLEGTLGCLVRLVAGQDSWPFILSNNHVLARNNRGHRGTLDGDPIIAAAGNPHPSPIGRLQAFEPIQFNQNNEVDAALAGSSVHLVASRCGPKNHPEAFTVVCTGLEDLVLQPTPGVTRVKKWGRTTGFTRGIVRDISGITPDLSYGLEQPATFHAQLVIESVDDNPFSQPGDSGSLIVEEHTNKPVGLLFAGGRKDNNPTIYTFANPIFPVFRDMKIEYICGTLP